MQILCTFTFNTETQTGDILCNCPGDAAIATLHNLIVAQAVMMATKEEEKPPDE